MPPRVLIAGVQSGVGKTTVATGLMAALNKKGYRVQGFKVGPDYIDPGYHAAATGNVSRNLDGWMVPPSALVGLFLRAAKSADLAVIEGVMGLFDGDSTGSGLSTAQVARLLGAPVLLVVDARGMAESAAALVWGYKHFDPEINLAGVIFNRVSSQRHCRLLKEEVENKTGVKVLGFLPKSAGLHVPERHLGLLPAAEKEDLPEAVERLGEAVKEAVDLEEVIDIAKEAPPLSVPPGPTPFGAGGGRAAKDVRLAVAKDAAFNFYYQDALDLVETYGAELVYFSPLADRALPKEVHGLYIGGGFPEVFLKELAGNEGLKEDIRRAFRRGMPIYAECGGLLYLCKEITGFDGQSYSMVGIVPAKARLLNRLAALGYVQAEVLTDNILARRGEVLRGHVFHYSVLENLLPLPPAYALKPARGAYGEEKEGFVAGNLLATYLHVHFAGQPQLVVNLVNNMRHFKALVAR